jgi:glycosyltransferase 2 family protein
MASDLTHPAPRRVRRQPLTQRAWWPATKRTATLLFFALVLWLLVTQARAVSWDEVMASIRDYPPLVLLSAAGLAMSSYAMYCSFDLMSRRYTGHKLSHRRVLATTFISYAFNLNLGSLVGGLGFRFRLYSQQGLKPDVISRIFGFTMLTNWLGYMVLAGVVCFVQPIALPEAWSLGSGALRVLGVVLLALGAAYLAACAFSPQRSWTVRGHKLSLPTFRLALLQLVASCITWLLIASVIHTLLQGRADYLTVLAVLLVSAVAGLITHVPAGLGVLEAVFVTLLTPEIPKSELLAALLVYRVVHYLIPLAQATVLYVLFEMHLKRTGRSK